MTLTKHSCPCFLNCLRNNVLHRHFSTLFICRELLCEVDAAAQVITLADQLPKNLSVFTRN